MSIRIDGTNTAANPGITGADADTGLQFGTDEIQLVTGGTNRATVESNGNFTIEDGNLVVAAGHGIDFSADPNAVGMTSELLDDYEEGIWTPQAFNNENGASTISTNTRAAKYIRVGKVVHICCYIAAVKGTNSGNFVIENLPFASDGNGQLHSGISVGYFHGLSVAKSMLCATVQPNSSTILLRCISGTQGGATATLSASEVSSSLDLIVGGTYIAA